jgi:predicted NBD/HSP70 family sugar kinase
VALRTELAEATGYPVVLEKDTTAAAVGELWTRRGPADDSFVFLYLGTGLGASLALDGDVVRGSSRNLGEIGHVVVDADGPECSCGLRGCVAVMCAPQAIVERAQRADVLDGATDLDDAASVDEAFGRLSALAAGGSEPATAVLREAAGHLAILLSVLTDFLDVDRVVLGGPFWSRVSDLYLQELPTRIAALSATRAVREPVRVDATVVGDDVGAVGAACVVLDSVLSPRASVLLFEPEPSAD